MQSNTTLKTLINTATQTCMRPLPNPRSSKSARPSAHRRKALLKMQALAKWDGVVDVHAISLFPIEVSHRSCHQILIT